MAAERNEASTSILRSLDSTSSVSVGAAETEASRFCPIVATREGERGAMWSNTNRDMTIEPKP